MTAGASYPVMCTLAGYGPPLDYDWQRRALGGNPDLLPFLNGKVPLQPPPLPNEAGWKDTVIMYPGQVTRIMVRWAPTDLPASTPPAAAATSPSTPRRSTATSGTATSSTMKTTR